ncbi:MAG: DNA mismatch repair protein MutT [Lysobacteraceae bacterium]|nr:MAG: DNA mismatch repair protein MutT [Xanthomonadaceae bacterium]
MPDAILHEGRYLRLRCRDDWEYAERTNARAAVIVVALTPDDRIVFVEQYRIPIDARSIEMPAGLVGDLGDEETIEEAARRELLEETGWAAEGIEFLMAGPSSSGMSNEQIAFVRATGLRRVGPGGGDASESIVVHEVPRREAPAWLFARMQEGYSIDPKLYAGLYFLERNPDGGRIETRSDPGEHAGE